MDCAWWGGDWCQAGDLLRQVRVMWRRGALNKNYPLTTREDLVHHFITQLNTSLSFLLLELEKEETGESSVKNLQLKHKKNVLHCTKIRMWNVINLQPLHDWSDQLSPAWSQGSHTQDVQRKTPLTSRDCNFSAFSSSSSWWISWPPRPSARWQPWPGVVVREKRLEQWWHDSPYREQREQQDYGG